MFYEEDEKYEITNTKTYHLMQDFIFKCKLQGWANDRIRLNWFGAVGNYTITGKKWSS